MSNKKAVGRYSPNYLVPKSLCQAISKVFPLEKEDGERKFSFELIGTILYKGNSAPISQGELMKLTDAPKNGSRLAELTERLRDSGLIDKSSYRFIKGGKGECITYSVAEEAYATAEKDDRFYKSWSDYKQGKPFKSKQSPFSKDDFLGNGKETTIQDPSEFYEAMEELSKVPFLFERVAALSHIRQDKEALKVALRLPHGIVYTNYSLAVSGRVMTRKPAIQCLKKTLRPFFLPRENYALPYFDYKTQEPRIAALLSGDAALWEALNSEKGIYTLFMDGFAIPERDLAKKVVNCIFNGGSIDCIAATRFHPDADKPYVRTEETKWAGAVYAFAKQKFTRFFEWKKEAAKQIREQGYAVTTGGTIRTNFDRDDEGKLIKGVARRSGVNHLIQGFAADIMRRLILRLYQVLPAYDSRLVIPVHDAVLIEAPVKNLTEVVAVVKRIMVEVPREFMPELYLPVEPSPSWSLNISMVNGYEASVR